MKLNGIFYLIITTIILVALAVMGHFKFDFGLIFYATLAGQLIFVFTVYKILTDDYKTDKTFDDWYEDHPIDNSQ